MPLQEKNLPFLSGGEGVFLVGFLYHNTIRSISRNQNKVSALFITLISITISKFDLFFTYTHAYGK